MGQCFMFVVKSKRYYIKASARLYVLDPNIVAIWFHITNFKPRIQIRNDDNISQMLHTIVSLQCSKLRVHTAPGAHISVDGRTFF